MNEPLRREDGRRFDPRVATSMLRVHATLLASKRRLLRHCMRRAANADAAQREQLLAVAERLERQLGQLHEQRSRWALLAPPNTPDYWIASYESLVALTQQLLSDMQAELPRLSAQASRELLMSDMPELRRQLAAYRSELRAWQKRQLNAGLQRGGGQRPGSGPRPRLTVVDVSESTPGSLGFAEER